MSLAAVALVGGSGSWAAITADKVQALIEKAKILGQDYKVSAAVNGEEAIIATYSSARSRKVDDDCKINAILMAKKIMEADPQDIKRVRVRFYDPNETKKYREVVIREGDIKAFGSRQMSQKDLLASIEITQGGGAAAPGVSEREIVPGLREEARKAIKRHITYLEGRRVGVGPFWRELARIEDEVKILNNASEAKDADKVKDLTTKIDQDVDRLLSALDRQEEALKAAQQSVERGKTGLKQQRTGASASQGQPAGGIVSLGSFTPSMDGPLFLDRLKIGEYLFSLPNKEGDAKYYQSTFDELEKLARGGDETRLRLKVDEVNRYFHIEPVTDEERKSTTILRY